jgi:hypothetical protein
VIYGKEGTSMSRTRRAAAVISAVVAALIAGGGAALADTANVTATVSGGSLSESTSATPSFSVTLNGSDQTGNYTLPITVTEARGSGAGWNLTITSTQFSTGGGSPNTLSTSASSIASVSSSCTGGTCTNATNGLTYPVAVPAGSGPPTAVKFFNAAANTGMGKFTITPSVNVAVPANSYAGSYSSTVTLAIATGP